MRHEAFCLRAPRYGLTLWCALGLLGGGTIQVPQLQLQFIIVPTALCFSVFASLLCLSIFNNCCIRTLMLCLTLHCMCIADFLALYCTHMHCTCWLYAVMADILHLLVHVQGCQLLATEPFLSLLLTFGTVCHSMSHLHHNCLSSAAAWRHTFRRYFLWL